MIAQFVLGNLYSSWKEVPHNDVEAAKWTHKAAEQGYPQAQLALALMYMEGHGVPQNYVFAYIWSNLSATNGITDAILILKMLTELMTQAQIAEAQKLVREWSPNPNRWAGT